MFFYGLHSKCQLHYNIVYMGYVAQLSIPIYIYICGPIDEVYQRKIPVLPWTNIKQREKKTTQGEEDDERVGI